MRRHHLYLTLIAAATVSALFVWRSSSGAPQKPVDGPAASERRPGHHLPLNQIVLFNSGVGYFQREGAIDGDARVDLQFPAGDVNDLLKSLVLHDQGNGKVTAISYDGQEPIERTLKTFAIDLTGNPTFGQLLNQARGEKIEVTLQNGSVALTGTIIGMEAQPEPGPREMIPPNPLDDNPSRPITIVQPHEVHTLNLLCADGMRSVPMNTIQRVRFLNAVLDSELRRALDALANAHNSQKKNVSVQFQGEGKRTVKVGYVVEAPMWKSSYRLVLDKEGKTTLQGWAIIENTTDEDWKDVRLALIASRPISFQMDLYPPLFVPRPVVEPERFASLRPPEYQGPMVSGMGGLGGIAGLGGAGMMGMGGLGFNQPGQAGNFQGQGNLGGGQMGFQGGFQGSFQGVPFNRYQNVNPSNQAAGVNRLTYDQLQKRRQDREKSREEAQKTGKSIDWNVEFDPVAGVPVAGVNAADLAETTSEQSRYTLDHKFSLARQRSALLPLVNQEITAQRVSIFNDKVNSKFPLRGLKIKNATKQNLMQGPVSVYDGDSYAGDARLPDLQANEERLLSFAVDQAVEIKSETRNAPETLTLVRIIKGVIEETHRQRATMRYLIMNRSGQERTLIVEHPIHAEWKLVGDEKPAERSRDYYRFEWKLPSGKGLVREVVQERTRRQNYALTVLDEKGIEVLSRHGVVSPKLREAFQTALEHKRKLNEIQRELVRLRSQFSEVTQEQNRVRTSLEKVPTNTALHKRYLEKLDKLETEIESLQAKIKENQEKEKKQQTEYVKYIEGLTVE